MNFIHITHKKGAQTRKGQRLKITHCRCQKISHVNYIKKCVQKNRPSSMKRVEIGKYNHHSFYHDSNIFIPWKTHTHTQIF